MDSKSINQNNFVIGSKPELIKVELMNFKEEVLLDLKELSKKLDDKYIKMNREIKDNMDSFNKKISDFNLKLLDISSRSVSDTTTKEKLVELLSFKVKAENMMNANKYNISSFDKEINKRMNQIENLIKSSFMLPRIIGPTCKYKNISDLIEYIFNQVKFLNEFKEKNLNDSSVFKTKIENLLKSAKIKMDSIQRDANYFSIENIQKSEEKIFQEISLRDEKLKDIRTKNQEYFSKLEENIKNIFDEINLIKEMKGNLNNKINNLENQNNEKFNKVEEKYKDIENKINNINLSLQETIRYLNKNGANIKIIKNNDDKRPTLLNNNDIINIKNNFGNEKNDILDEEAKKDNIKEKIDKRIKSTYEKESDISKYVRGEITANQIGSSTNRHRKVLNNYKNQYLEQLIKKSDYEKSLSNQKISENKKTNNISKLRERNKLNDEFNNEDLYINHANSSENIKLLKVEKRKAKTIDVYKNVIKSGFSDLDARFHSEGLKINYEFQNNKNNDFSGKYNKENSYINNKNNIEDMNIKTLFNPHNNQKIKKKLLSNNINNLNIFPNYKVVTFKNIDQELSRSNFIKKNEINKSIKTRLLSPFVVKINKYKIYSDNNKNLNKLNTNIQLPSKIQREKFKKKIVNSDFDNIYFNRDEIKNNIFNSDLVENTK